MSVIASWRWPEGVDAWFRGCRYKLAFNSIRTESLDQIHAEMAVGAISNQSLNKILILKVHLSNQLDCHEISTIPNFRCR